MFCGVFGHKPSSGVVPTTGNYPPTTGENARFLGIGPIARRAEDLIAVLRLIAGPDGQDRYARNVKLGDPSSVSLAGLRVILTDHTTIRPISRDAARRARAGGRARCVAAGAKVERVSLRSWRGAVIPFLTTLEGRSERSTLELVAEAAEAPPRDHEPAAARRSAHAADQDHAAIRHRPAEGRLAVGTATAGARPVARGRAAGDDRRRRAAAPGASRASRPATEARSGGRGC